MLSNLQRRYFMDTDRLQFSCWLETDRDYAVTLWGNMEVTKYICASGIYTEQEIESRLFQEINKQAKYGMQYWPIFHKANNDFIGCCGLRPYDWSNHYLEIGVHIAKPYWGYGYAYEAAQKVIEYGFKTLHANILVAGHNPNNKKSKRLLLKLGFHYIRDEYYEPTGLMHPTYLLNPVIDCIRNNEKL